MKCLHATQACIANFFLGFLPQGTRYIQSSACKWGKHIHVHGNETFLEVFADVPTAS
jgi:hypothetical protein